MSKVIKLSQDILDQYTQEFYETLRTGKFSDGKVNFTKTLGTVDRKATVLFTEMAWQKMQTLVREFDKEVAWHGIAERCNEKDAYLISDILVYPQEVTGATVTTDQEKYQMWLMSQEDEVFNNIRMQGHSHVNMGVTPSSVDLNLYESILEQLDEDMFYIFMIWNKRWDKTIKIYDIRENILFETADVTVSVQEEDDGLSAFLKEAKELVVSKVYNYEAIGSTYYGYGAYGNYSGVKGQASDSGEKNKGTTVIAGDKKNNVRKGSRNKNVKAHSKSGTSVHINDEYDDEYWERKYGGRY